MELGETVWRRLEYGGEGGSLLPPAQGRVVYIHPERRYYTVEFEMGRGRRIRESYPLRGRITQETAEEELRDRRTGARLPGRTKQRKRPVRGGYLEADQKK